MSETRELETSRYGAPIYRAEEEPKDLNHLNSRKGTHKVLNKVAAVALGLGTAFAPTIAGAEPTNTEVAQVDLTQNNHENALNALTMTQENRAKYTGNWFAYDVGSPFYQIYDKQFTSTEDLGNGYTAHLGVDGLKVITNKDNLVVFKNVIIGPAIDGELDVIMIPTLLRAEPMNPTPAPEYGDGMVRLSFPERALAVIVPQFSGDWIYVPVKAIEGFKATTPEQYSGSPWIIADSQPQAGNPDNPPQ